MRQDKDVQYTLLIIRCFMHSDRMRTNAISKSMIQVLYCRAVSCCEMYCIGYSLFDNLVCSLFVHVGVLCCFALFVCLTLLASFFLPSHLSLKTCTVQYCSHYSLVYTYSVLNYSYIRNGSTTITSTGFSPFSAPWTGKLPRGYVSKSSASLNPLTITQLACELSMRGRSRTALLGPSISGAHAHYICV